MVVINLQRRADRWKRFLSDLPSGWPFGVPLRFPAIDGLDLTVPQWWNEGSGAWGCYLSHCKVLEDCLRDGIESVLVLEDDALFCPDFPLEVRHFLHALPADWEFLFFGGEHIELHLGLPEQLNEWVYRPYNANRMHAYGIRIRAMIERVLDHFHDTDHWTAMHHVDRHLGELQKRDRTGFYVPKQWLVYQCEGVSDICDQELSIRACMGAEDIVHPVVDKPIVAVLSPSGNVASLVAGCLHHLGIPMGNRSDLIKQINGRWNYEASDLVRLCQRFYEEPWYVERLPFEQRVRLLRIWAASHCKSYSYEKNLLGAMHPTLCLMGQELLSAWNNPYFLSIEQDLQDATHSLIRLHPNWPVDTCMSICSQFNLSRNQFLADCPNRSRTQSQDGFAISNRPGNSLSKTSNGCRVSQAMTLCFFVLFFQVNTFLH